MNTYERGETVIVTSSITNSDGDAADPATSIKVTVTDRAGTAQVDGVAMTKDETGEYHYDVATASGWEKGLYTVNVVAVGASRTTIERGYFMLI